MRGFFALALALALVGCGPGGPPPPTDGGSTVAAEVVYLVHNELWHVGLDGSGRARLATVGDDPYRTGFPRRLADGTLAVLADDTGAIFPYVVDGAATSHVIGTANVSLHDALCAATVGGAATLVYTVTPFGGGQARLVRAPPSGGTPRAVAVETDGEVVEPAPWDDGHVLVVRSAEGQVTVEILGVNGDGTRQVLATVDAPYSAHAAARLPDGRVVYVRTDPRDSTDTAIGELFVLDRGGVARTTGITGVRALEVVGGAIVYEEGGADGVTDLVRTNLVDPPVNLTRTPTIAEHLGWSD